MSEHLSDLALDAIRRGGSREGAEHVASCPACQARQAALAGEDEAFIRSFVPAQLAVATLARAERRRPRWRWWPVVPLAVAAAAAMFVLAPRDTLRTKGDGAVLAVFLRDGAQTVAVDGPVDARAHLAVQVKGPGFARVLWSSSPDVWEPLFPTPGASAWAVESSSWLPNEVVLDGAPQDERIGAVVCPEAPAEDAAAAMLAGAEPGECRVQWVTIEKR